MNNFCYGLIFLCACTGVSANIPEARLPKAPTIAVVEHKPADDRHILLSLPAVKITAATKIFIGTKEVTFKEVYDFLDEDKEYTISELTVKYGKVTKIVFEKE